METYFSILSFSPGIFWLFILFAPQKKYAMRAVDCFLFALAISYSVLILPDVIELLPIIADPTLASIQNFLATPKGTVGAWNHMILADLWIGRWVAQDSLKSPYPKLLRFTCVPIILFFGPLGLALYLVCRGFSRRPLFVSEY